MTTLALPFLLGLTHSFEADHVLAVATLNTNNNSIRSQAWKGIVWGFGHAIPVLLFGFMYLIFKIFFLDKAPINLEVPVGLLMIVAGVYKILDHKYGKTDHKHYLFVGIIHGIAGSAGVVLLNFTQESTTFLQCVYLLLFSIGAILGMGGINVLVSKISNLLSKLRILTFVVPLATIIYGGFIIYQNI